MAAVALRPCHADPAALRHLAAEGRVAAAPGSGALLRGPAGEFFCKKGTDLVAELLGRFTDRRHGERK